VKYVGFMSNWQSSAIVHSFEVMYYNDDSDDDLSVNQGTVYSSLLFPQQALLY